MTTRKKIKGRRRWLACLSFVLAICWCFSLSEASDFDFYGPELIARNAMRRISLDLEDASLVNVLKVFSQQSGLNFIASENVNDRTLTLYLEEVPLQEALNKIMKANNLTYELDPGSNVFIVKEWGRSMIDTVTKIYPLQYARLKSSKLEAAIAGIAEDSGGGGGGEEGLEALISSVLTENGNLVVDNRTNSLIVTDIPTQFELIDKLIAMIDIATPQVMIEVEMLDVSKAVVDTMGVDYNEGNIVAISGSSRGTKFPFSTDHLSDAGGAAFNYGTLSASVFQAAFQVLSTDARTKFLARPRILTLSNESAEFKIITDEAIGQQQITSSSEGTGSTTAEAERYETGVILKVTPQVDMVTGFVTMFIQPTVSETKAGAVFGGVAYKDPEVRSSSSTLMVREGETIVVGGLIREKEDITEKKIPFFCDIPFIGAAFRHKSSTLSERELIIFITPRVLKMDNVVDFVREELFDPTPISLSSVPMREQSTGIERRKKIDSVLERWDN